MEITKKTLPVAPNIGKLKINHKIQLKISSDSGTLTIQDLDNRENYLIVPINEKNYKKVTKTKYVTQTKNHYSRAKRKELEKFLYENFQVNSFHAKKLDALVVEGLIRWDKAQHTHYLANYLNVTLPMGKNNIKGEKLKARNRRKKEENDERWYVHGITIEYNLAGGKLMDKLKILKNAMIAKHLWGGEENIVVKNEDDYPVRKDNSMSIFNKVKDVFTKREKHKDNNDRKILKRIKALAVLSGLGASLGLSALVGKFTKNYDNNQNIETNLNKNDNNHDEINQSAKNFTDLKVTDFQKEITETTNINDDKTINVTTEKDEQSQETNKDLNSNKDTVKKVKHKNNKKAILSKIKVGSEFKNMNKGRYYEAPDGTGRSGSFENQEKLVKKISKIGIRTKNGNYIVIDENNDMNLYEIKKQYPNAEYSYHITDTDGNAYGWVTSSSFDSAKNMKKMEYINTKSKVSHKDDIER